MEELIHPDIAFEFGMWISPQFENLPRKEFQRQKRRKQLPEIRMEFTDFSK